MLYTCDAFGLHYCEEPPYDSELAPIEPHFRFYYECLMRPNARSVLSALKCALAAVHGNVRQGMVVFPNKIVHCWKAFSCTHRDWVLFLLDSDIHKEKHFRDCACLAQEGEGPGVHHHCCGAWPDPALQHR